MIPGTQAAWMPTRIASDRASAARPSSTSSSAELTPLGNALATSGRTVGQYASYVEAASVLYRLEPTLLPLRATPPGNGRITPGTALIAATAASAAARVTAASA